MLPPPVVPPAPLPPVFWIVYELVVLVVRRAISSANEPWTAVREVVLAVFAALMLAVIRAVAVGATGSGRPSLSASGLTGGGDWASATCWP